MTSLLALDTAGSHCSVALWSDGERVEDTRNVRRSHNDHLLPMVDGLLARAGLAPQDLDLVAFAAGPGSFTGVRIAAAAAQGIALGARAQIVAVPSTAALARCAWRRHGETATQVLVCIHSRQQLVYVAGFNGGDEPVAAVEPRLCGSASELPDLADGPWLAVGNRPDWWPEGELSFTELATGLAPDVAALALAAWGRGEARDAAEALPVYIEGDSPWRPAR